MSLALLGGQPIRGTYLSYGKQSIDEEDIKAVTDVLRGDYLTTGPMVNRFEKAVAEYVGTKYAVAVSNGTAALHVAMFGCGIEKGDEVIVTPMTFAASSNAILYMGAIPVFADVDEATYNIDVSKIEEKITSKTKAIVAVDFTGQPVDLEELRRIADQYKLKLIEDGAHSLGSEYKGKKVGGFADATTFSFHPVKPITTGEGGMITTNNEEIYQRMLLFRSHGITRDKEILVHKEEGPWFYEQHALGFNYRLTDIQAALGLSQMHKLDAFLSKRREIVNLYNEAFSEHNALILPFEKEDRKSGWHIYVIRLGFEHIKASRKQIVEALIAENIGVNVHYIPVYYHPYYRKLGYQKGICPIAEEVYEGIITLPLFPQMTDQDVHDVIQGVRKVLDYYQKDYHQ
ncbi:MAG: UDP-4-amino-4,6-dideoxy-N-acetyl-beta-L-altrosamine transaminase [Clostridium sp.]|nr:UDP-4-amino-4,6-dideoxy-N-acetyl-beta-L-altrosamine transaminase [Clostridium sp.]